MKLAVNTLKAINDMLEHDQGAQYRVWLGRVLPHIGDAYSDNTFPFRAHLGASILGRYCSRQIWFSWRWFKKPFFQGRMIRLFNRGHLEEGRFIAMLLACGMTVYQQDENGKQFRISDKTGHIGGSGDGIVFNCPDLPVGEFGLLEFKTHGEKSFNKLIKSGVLLAKPEHYAQMQIYMNKMGLLNGLYMAVNKNTDDIHAEIIEYNQIDAEMYLEKGAEILASTLDLPPNRLNDNPAYFECRYCDYNEICHNQGEIEVNCRTCKYSNPTSANGLWVCSKGKDISTSKAQLKGCESYLRGF